MSVEATVFLVGVVSLFTFWRYMGILKEPNSVDFRVLRRQIACADTAQKAYGQALALFLDWVDRVFDRWGHATARPEAPRPAYKPQAWSANAYSVCLLLALVYPNLSAVVSWTVLGHAGVLGEVLGFARMDNTLFRASTAGSLSAATLFCILFVFWGNDYRKWVFLGFSVALFYFGAYLVPRFFDEDPLYIGIAGTDSVTIVLMNSTAFFIAIVTACVFAFTLASIGRYVIFIRAKRSCQKRVLGPFLFWITALLLGGGWLSAGFTAKSDQAQTVHYMFVIFILLPLLLAPFDWTSLGLTRYLLRKNVKATSAWQRLGLSLLDFILALFALVLLAFTLVGASEVYNARVRPGLGRDFVDVGAQLLDIRENPWDGGHFWTYFTLFSTLIPTALHAVIGGLSLVTVRPAPLRRCILEGMTRRKNHGGGTRVLVASALTVRWIIAVCAVGVSFYLLGVLLLKVWGVGPWFLDLLLWWQATVAGWLA
jgi:hypothetical protein